MKINPAWALAIAAFWSSACSRPAPPEPAASAPAPPAAHEHVAPHGGVLVSLGEEFASVEFVVDPAAGVLTAYVFDGEAEESLRLKQPSLKVAIEGPAPAVREEIDLSARVNILTGETVGDSSEFSTASASLRGVRSINARIVDVVVKGQEFRGISFSCFPVAR